MLKIWTSAILGLAIAGCGRNTAEPVHGPEPTATINEIMKTMIVPLNNAASYLPEAITDPETPAGLAGASQVDADWQKIHDAALAISEMPNLFTMEGRKVAAPGVKLENEGQPTYLTAVQMGDRIRVDRAGFLKHAKQMQDASLALAAAATAKNVDALYDAGGKLEESCSSCHAAFWYPPPAP